MMVVQASTNLESKLLIDSLRFEAPYLLEKLLKDRIVESNADADELFTEVKRYLVLAELDHDRIIEMYSFRVDEVWHQFVLFTEEYIRFCRQYYGRYISHRPGNAPKSEHEEPRRVLSFREFSKEYERFFKIPLPSAWFDQRSITMQRRVINDSAGKLILQSLDGVVALVDQEGSPLISANDFAKDALAFIANTGAFYVRELPGAISDDERVDLICTLVEHKFLRVAS